MIVKKYSGAGGSSHGNTENVISKTLETPSSSPYLIGDSIFVLLVIGIAAYIAWKLKNPK